MSTFNDFKKGSIMQVTNEDDRWFGAVFVVDEVKKWGVQGYVTTSEGNAYIRINNEDMEHVGEAIIVFN